MDHHRAITPYKVKSAKKDPFLLKNQHKSLWERLILQRTNRGCLWEGGIVEASYFLYFCLPEFSFVVTTIFLCVCV